MKKLESLKNQQVGYRNKDVTISNALIHAGHKLNLEEKRLVISAIVLFRPNSKDSNDKMVEIHAADYAKTFNIPLTQAYERMQRAAKSLYERSITLRNCDSKGRYWSEVNLRWVQSCSYKAGEGKVGLTFSDMLHKDLMTLRSHFTRYRLEQAFCLKSTYTWRLLELFEQMLPQDTTSGWLEISIEDFWLAMDATDTHRKDFGKTREKIIEPAIKELTEKGQWSIQWEALKTGRKVARLNFKFTKPGRKLAIGEQEFETPRETVLEADSRILGDERAQMEQERQEKVNQLKLGKMLNSLGEWTKFSK